MRFNSSATCLVTCELTGAVARGCIQAASYPIQRRFAAEKWVMRDDDPPVGRCALSRGFCEVGVWLVLFNLKTDF